MAVFAIEVRSGKELQAKEMIKHLLKKSTTEETHLVDSIYTLQTCTTYIRDHVDNSSQVEENDVYNKLVADSIVSLLGNLKKQYEEIKYKNDDKSIKEKAAIKEEISKLNKEIQGVRSKSKKIKALLPGYILIELKTDADYLPDALWHLIMNCPLVRSIPSRFSIPSEEVSMMFDQTVAKAQVEVQFETVVDYEKIEKQEKDLIHKANMAASPQKEKEYLAQSEKLKENLVSEVNEIKDSSNVLVKHIKACIRNKKETITMSVSLFLELYNEFIEVKVLPPITSKDFLNRLKRLSKGQIDMVALE